MQGLTPIDLADSDMEKYLEELKKKQMEKPKINVCIANASLFVDIRDLKNCNVNLNNDVL